MVDEVNNHRQIFSKLLAGRIDLWIIDRVRGLKLMQERGGDVTSQLEWIGRDSISAGIQVIATLLCSKFNTGVECYERKNLPFL